MGGGYDYYVNPMQFRRMNFGYTGYPMAVPMHECKATTTERLRNYHEGVLNYHRQRGLDLSKFERECKDPACVLQRITK